MSDVQDYKKLQPAFDKACNQLASVFSRKNVGDKDKFALQIAGIYGKLRATERSHLTLRYLVARDIANHDISVLKGLVRNSIPELNPENGRKLIEGKKQGKSKLKN